MAKPLVLRVDGQEFPLELTKVDRSDLYGYIETEALDSKGRRCLSATLADDGQTLVGPGGSAFACLSPEGRWLEKSALKAVDAEGKALAPVPSSYSAPVDVTRTASIDEFLTYNIRSAYQVGAADGADLGPLAGRLKGGEILTFPYSYRGGLEPDTGFLLLAADGTPFLCIGNATKLEFVGFDQPVAAEEEPGEETEEIDFGMM
jgi:hypothetical protein